MSVPPEYINLLLGMQNDPNAAIGVQPQPGLPSGIPAPAPMPVQAPPAPQTAAPQAPLFDINDPATRMAMLSASLSMFQPVAPGQSQVGHVAQALQGGIGTLNTLQEQRRKAGLEERTTSTGERRVDVAERGIDETARQFDKTMGYKWEELELDKKYKQALIEYYGRLSTVSGGKGDPLSEADILEWSTKMAQTEWDGLITAGMPVEELLQRYPGGVGSLAQAYAQNARAMVSGKANPDLAEQHRLYALETGRNPITGLPLPMAGQPGAGGKFGGGTQLPTDPVERARMELQQTKERDVRVEEGRKADAELAQKKQAVTNIFAKSGALTGFGNVSNIPRADAEQAFTLMQDILKANPNDTNTYNQLKALLQQYPNLGQTNGQ